MAEEVNKVNHKRKTNKQRIMKPGERKFVRNIIIFFLILVLIIGIGFFIVSKVEEAQRHITYSSSELDEFTREEQGTRVNVSKDILETKKFENYEISNAELKQENSVIVFTADIKNIAGEPSAEKELAFTFVNKAGNEIATISAHVGALNAGEQITVVTNTTLNILTASNYNVSVK